MSIQNFFKSLISTPTRRRPSRRKPATFRPRLEALEDRRLLAGAVVSVPDAYTVAENQTLSVPAPGVMANDTYGEVSCGSDACMVPIYLYGGQDYTDFFEGTFFEGLIFTGTFSGGATLNAGPAHGALDFNYDGSFTYTPSSGFYGLDSFIYTVVSHTPNGSGFPQLGGDPTRVTILVTPEGDSSPSGITVTPTSGLITTEAGGTAQFSVALNSMPTANVVIPLLSSDSTEGTVSAASLTFTTLNWNIPQTVTVTGKDDVQIDGNQPYTIVTGPANSADSNYNGRNAADVAVTNTDNDVLTAYATASPQNIPDRSTIRSTITITDSYAIQDVNVQLDISHTYDADLDVFLIAPDGTRVELFTDVGGNKDHFNGTMLDDEAGTAITDGQAPFSGSYRPEGSLAALNGKNVQGTWTLEISDDFKNNTGRLNSWSMLVTHAVNPGAPGASSSSASSDASILAALLDMAMQTTSASYPSAASASSPPATTEPAVADPITAPVDAFFATADLDDPNFAFDGLKEDYLDPITGEWLAEFALLKGLI